MNPPHERGLESYWIRCRLSTAALDRLREAKKDFARRKGGGGAFDTTVAAWEVSGMPMPARRLIPVLGLILMVTSAPGAQDGAPWIGNWQLDPARGTQRTTPSPYKRVTLSITPHDDGLKVLYDMVGTRGGVTHREWTGRLDGRDYPMQGVDMVMTNAYRLVDGRTYEITVKVEGNQVATARTTVSPDGSTLTVVTRERDARGQPVESTAVYRRVR